MATTKKTIIESTESGEPSALPEELDADGIAEDTDLQTLLTEIGTLEDHRVRVTRMEPKRETCETYNSVDFSIDRVRREYGSGKFQFSIILPNGRVKTHRVVVIAQKHESPSTAVVAAPAGASMSDMMALLFRMQSERSESTLKWAAIIMPALTTAVTAYFSRPRDTRKEIDPGQLQTQFLEQMRLAKEMFGANNSQGGVDTLLKAIEVVKDLVPGGSSDDGGVMGLISKALPLVTQLIPNKPASPHPVQAMTRPASPPPSAVFIPPDPPEPAALAEPLNPEEQEQMNLLTWARHQVANLIDKAGRGLDFELYGDVMLAELPEAVSSEALLNLLEDPAWFDKLAMINSGVRAHPEWFQELRDYVVQELHAIKAEALEQDRREKERAQRIAKRGETVTVLRTGEEVLTRVPDFAGDSHE